MSNYSINNDTNETKAINNKEEPQVIKYKQYIRENTDMNYYKLHKEHKTFWEIYDIIRNHKWDHNYDKLPFLYGSHLLGACSTLSAAYVNYHFRETLMLLRYTRLSSYLIMFLFPGISAGILHFIFVTRPILEERRVCSTCLQVRGMGLQVLTSVGWPFILVPLLCYPVAKRLNMHSVPNLKLKNPRPIIQFTREMLRPIKGNLMLIGALQTIVGMGMTFYEQDRFANIIKPVLLSYKTKFSVLYPRHDVEDNLNN